MGMKLLQNTSKPKTQSLNCCEKSELQHEESPASECQGLLGARLVNKRIKAEQGAWNHAGQLGRGPAVRAHSDVYLGRLSGEPGILAEYDYLHIYLKCTMHCLLFHKGKKSLSGAAPSRGSEGQANGSHLDHVYKLWKEEVLNRAGSSSCKEGQWL